MSAYEFQVVAGGQGRFALPPMPFRIGSSAPCEVQFGAGLLAPEHVAVSADPTGTPVAKDLSGQGFWLNGRLVNEGPLTPGAVLRLGDVELLFNTADVDDATIRPMSHPRGERIDATTRRPTPFAAPRPSAPEHSLTMRTQSGGGAGPDLVIPAPQPSNPGGVLSALGGSAEPLRAGYVIQERYRILGKLAAGGMGEVYRAEHVELGRAFAIKVMRPELSGDPEFVTRFKREAISASRIGQQNIVDISDFGQTQDGRFFFVMEFLEGLTIASLVHRSGALEPARAITIILQVARALAAAHSQGIVHRDMKPENVIVLQRPGQPDFVKVLDFGVAKVQGPSDGSQTATGLVVGTPQYMAPEQARAVGVDARTDIYALGLILYEMLAGRAAFIAETPSMLIVKQVTEAPPPFEPHVLNAVPQTLHALVFQMLEKDPAARPQTMDAVIEVLEPLLTSLRIATSGVTRTMSGKFPGLATPSPGIEAVRASGVGPAPAAQARAKAPTPKPRTPAAPGPRDEETSADADVALALPRSKAPVIGAVVVGLVVVAGIALFAGGSQGKAGADPKDGPVQPPAAPQAPSTPVAEQPAPPAAPPKVKVTLSSEPVGAELYEGDVLLGTTPLPLEREQGAVVELRFVAKGYAPQAKKIGFSSDGQSLTVTLEKDKAAAPAPAAPATGKKAKGDLKDPFANDDDLKDAPF